MVIKFRFLRPARIHSLLPTNPFYYSSRDSCTCTQCCVRALNAAWEHSMLRESTRSGILQIASGLRDDLTDRPYSCWILKQWGLHEVSDTGTLSKTHVNCGSKYRSTKQWAAHNHNCSDWSRSQVAHCLALQSNCEVRNSQKDSFQQCLTNLSVKDGTKAASKYVTFQIESPKLSTEWKIKDWLVKCIRTS